MTKPPSPQPLSIKVIAITYVVSGFWHILSLISIVMGGGTTVAGFLVYGWLAFFYNLIVAVMVPLSLGFGLWRLEERIRRIAAWWQGFTILYSLCARLNSEARIKFIEEIAHARGVEPAAIAPILTAMWFLGLSIGVGLSGLVLWFLIKRKSAFVKPRMAPPFDSRSGRRPE